MTLVKINSKHKFFQHFKLLFIRIDETYFITYITITHLCWVNTWNLKIWEFFLGIFPEFFFTHINIKHITFNINAYFEFFFRNTKDLVHLKINAFLVIIGKKNIGLVGITSSPYPKKLRKPYYVRTMRNYNRKYFILRFLVSATEWFFYICSTRITKFTFF